MSQTLITIEYKSLEVKAVSKRGSILVDDHKNGQEYWILRRVFMRLINLERLDGVIASSTPNEFGKEFKTLMVLSPF